MTRKQTNALSLLLKQQENETLFSLLGRGCTSLASAVVQLFKAENPTASKWKKLFCGVACFIKDNTKRSYFIRIYDIVSKQQLWEQELYNKFRYKLPREFFHTFEADDAQVGLNFASEDEAERFQSTVYQKLQERHDRRMERKTMRARPPPPPGGSENVPPSPMHQVNVEKKPNSPPATVITSNVQPAGKGNKRRISKSDIGAPTEFRHVSHVGWDPNKGFDMNNLDPDMRQVFMSVGITSNEQADQETVEFIYDFVQKHGGIDAIKQELSGTSAANNQISDNQTKTPAKGSTSSRSKPPPPVPDHAPPQRGRGSVTRSQLPSPPTNPPGQSRRPPPPPARINSGSVPSAPGNVPPPPPVPVAPPPPSMSASPSPPENVTRSSPAAAPVVDGRSNLLREIEMGKNLKKVQVDADKKPLPSSTGGGGILNTLKSALDNKRKNIWTEGDSNSEDDDDDDEEWED